MRGCFSRRLRRNCATLIVTSVTVDCAWLERHTFPLRCLHILQCQQDLFFRPELQSKSEPEVREIFWDPSKTTPGVTNQFLTPLCGATLNGHLVQNGFGAQCVEFWKLKSLECVEGGYSLMCALASWRNHQPTQQRAVLVSAYIFDDLMFP